MPQENESAEDAGETPVAILVVRAGGMAGLRRAWRVQASGPGAQPWVELVDACPWHDQRTLRPQPDRFTWELTAAHGDTDLRTILGERDLDGAWRQLVDAVIRDGSPCSADAP
jgi:hypothetical protein